MTLGALKLQRAVTSSLLPELISAKKCWDAMVLSKARVHRN